MGSGSEGVLGGELRGRRGRREVRMRRSISVVVDELIYREIGGVL